MIWSNLDSVCQIADRKFADFWPNVGQLLISLKKFNRRICRDFAKLRQPFANIWQFVHQKKTFTCTSYYTDCSPTIHLLDSSFLKPRRRESADRFGRLDVGPQRRHTATEPEVNWQLAKANHAIGGILNGYRDCVNPLRNDHLSFLRHTFYDSCSGTSQTKGLEVNTDEYWDFNNETRFLHWIIILCMY